MSPTTSIPVCRISVAIEVTSNSSTLHRCWISPPANVVSRHHVCLPSTHAVRGHVRETVHGRHGEAFLRLSAIRNNLRAGSSTSRQGILNGDIVLGKDLCLRDAVRIGILAPLRSATTALAYFLWGRSAWPRSQHSLHRCADVAASTQPRDEGIRGTSSLVLVWGKCCPAGAGRCLEHHKASRSTASSRRMISAVHYESFAER